MLNLEKSYIYQGPGDEQYSYYADYQDPNTFYIAPTLEFAIDPATGKPIFKLVEYQTSDINNGSGYCAFTAQLSVPNTIIDAVTADIKKKGYSTSPKIAPLLYGDGGTATLTYPNPKDPDKPNIAVVTSSALTPNLAAFLINLDKDGVQNFKNAYSTKGSKGFPIQYIEYVDGVVPSLTVEVSFNASIAYTYSDKVTTHTWSKDTHDISRDLVKSHAGKVTVTPGSPKPPQDVIDKFTKWGQDTLANAVSKQAQECIDVMKDDFDVSKMTSFTETYSQNQVIAWHIQPVKQLESPVTDALAWSNFYETVDMRLFTLMTTMNISDKGLDEKDQVKSITVNVDYPTLNPPNNSAILTPDQHSHTFSSPIAADGNLEYNMSYVVTYKDGSQLKVTQNGRRESAYTISAPDVGIISIQFVTNDMKFVTKTEDPAGLNGIEVDFFYKDLSGGDDPVMQSIPFGFPTGAKDPATNLPIYKFPLTYDFVSKTGKPLYNAYVYTVTYLFNDGSKVIADPVTSNANLAFKNTEASQTTARDNQVYLRGTVTDTNFDIFYFPPKVNDLKAYMVKVNEVEGDGTLKFVGQTNVVPAENNFPSYKVKTLNPGNQPYSVGGTQVTESGPIIVQPTITTNSYAYLYNDQRYFSVTVDPTLIKWQDDGLSMIQLNIVNSTKDVKNPVTQSLTFTQVKEGKIAKQYWGFNYVDTDSPRYDFNIVYSYAGRDPVTVNQTAQVNTILVIPATPSSEHLEKAMMLSKKSSL